MNKQREIDEENSFELNKHIAYLNKAKIKQEKKFKIADQELKQREEKVERDLREMSRREKEVEDEWIKIKDQWKQLKK
ncbi:MAG: hypothetical protein ACTSO7_03650 [Candidatus Heimdallarchaeota archaeon]